MKQSLLTFVSLLGLLAAHAGPESFGALAEGGPIAADGKTAVVCDLPLALRLKNTGGSDGEGLCVFTSLAHAARWSNEQRLWNLQQQMTREPGGGTPSKVTAMIAKYGPGTPYLQHTGGDVEFLRAALKTGRMVCVTYCGGPGDPHYGGQVVAHMVNLVYLSERDDGQACILDNNFIGEKQLLWMSVPEFVERWKGENFYVRIGPRRMPVGGSWAIVLLDAPPPPAPRVS